MDLASGVGGLISLGLELTTITYKYITDVRNAPEESKELHNELTALVKGLESLRLFLDTQDTRQMPFTSTSALVASTNVCENDLNYLKSKLLDFKKLYEEKKWYRRLAWPFKKEDHARLLRRIKDYTQTFHFSVSLEGCGILAQTSEEVDKMHRKQNESSRDVSEIFTVLKRLKVSIQEGVEAQRQQLEDIRKSLQSYERQTLLNWLSNADPSTNHNRATEKKESGTGEWFLSSENFTNWIDSAGFIWLYGLPGCGKTVLCSTIIDCVQDICRTLATCKSAYFYFDFQKAADQNIEVMLRSLLRQLCSNEPGFPPAVQELHKRCKESGHSPSRKDLEDVLIETVKNIGKEVYILVDALDELQEEDKKRAQVLQHIKATLRLGLPNLHVLATSRDELDIRRGLESISNGGTPIAASEVDSDIGKYVRSCLQEWSLDLPGHIKEHIETRLSKGAHGMFRWAFCQIETLERCIATEEIEDALDDLPTTLDETYERILQDMWRNNAKKAQNILTWLLFSERALTLNEAADAAVVQPGDNPLNPRSRLLDPTQVLRICRSLIIVSDELSETMVYSFDSSDDSLWDEMDTAPTLRFAHFSVKEYLVSGRSKVFTGIPMPSHKYIADCCVSMLLPIDQLKLERQDVKDLLGKNQLLRYAAESWCFHIRQLEDHGQLSSELSARLYDLLDRGPVSENCHAWMILSHDGNPWRDFLSPPRGTWKVPLLYSSFFGLADATHHFIKAVSGIKQSFDIFGTALHTASCGANADLLDTEKNITRALRWAISGGHERIVRLLLEHGANANDGIYDAARPGHETILRILLEHGADASKVIHHAAADGHATIVRLLLENRADASKGLRAAVEYRNATIVRLLLEHGGDSAYADALQDAVKGGSIQMAEMLVQKGAKICSRVLYAAVRKGNIEMFEWLLERGASIRSPEGGRHLMILAAVDGGSPGIVSRLVELGVDINDLGCLDKPLHSKPLYTTALQHASLEIKDDIVKYLLEIGAEVNKPGGTFGTALQATISGSYIRPWSSLLSERQIDILRLLLKHGADINQHVCPRSYDIPFRPYRPTKRKGNALQQAVALGNYEIVQLLVKSGADIDAQKDHCGTALMCASRISCSKVLEVLVSEGADINAEAPGIGSALSEAARWGHCENVQLLIEKGADINAYVGGVGTALSTALLNRQIEAAVFLIEAGSDLHAAINAIGTAFSLASEDEYGEIVKFCLASFSAPRLNTLEQRYYRRVPEDIDSRRMNVRSCG